MNNNKTTTITCLTLIVVLTFITTGKPALAVDDLGLFELDGNALQDAANPPDDWELLYNGGNGQIVFTGIIPDPNQDTIFVGGRKDIQELMPMVQPITKTLTLSHISVQTVSPIMVMPIWASGFSRIRSPLMMMEPLKVTMR
ncbi:MAG: hypothetical protein ACYS9V_10915 [Planctomycetota bacterium]|jgi:hypothetical protein